MTTLYENFLSGSIMDDPLLVNATIINSMEFASIPVVTAPDIMWMVLDPKGLDGSPEIVKIISHVALTTKITCLRAQQSTVAREHAIRTDWAVTVTKADLESLPSSTNVYPNIAARDLDNANQEPGAKAYVINNRTEYAWIEGTGSGQITLPGLKDTYLSTVDSGALDLTGDFEIVLRLNLVDWITGTYQMLVVKDDTTINRAYSLYINPAGNFVLEANTATMLPRVSTAVPPLVNGATYWLKATFDVNNGASGSTTNFYYAADQPTEPSSWTTIGSPVVLSGTGAIAAVSVNLLIGNRSVVFDFPTEGTFYRVLIRNGIAGTTVADMNAATSTTTSATWVSATTGETWTINGLGPAWVIMYEPKQVWTVISVIQAAGTVTCTTTRGWSQRSGGIWHAHLSLSFTSAGTVGGEIFIPLPYTLLHVEDLGGSFLYLDNGIAWYSGHVVGNSTTKAVLYGYNVTTDFGGSPSIGIASGDQLRIDMQGTY